MKSLHRLLLFILMFLTGGRASALDVFECVRDLMPISEQASFQAQRAGVEHPFMLDGRFMIFPEVKKGQITGFFVYTSSAQAFYYDAVRKTQLDQKPVTTAIRSLPKFENHVYQMTAQPSGIETMTLLFMPGYLVEDTTGHGPVVLGASVLPVVGAFISRKSDQLKTVYHNPADAHESDLQQWVYSRQARRPASVKEVEVPRVMVQLTNIEKKSLTELWAPLKAEFKVRKHWVQNHNLDENAFRQFNSVLRTTCRE